MPFTVSEVTGSEISLRWREAYVSDGVNRKQAVRERGIVRGFRPVKGSANSELWLEPDNVLGDSVMNLVGRDLSGEDHFLTYRVKSRVTINLNDPLISLGREYAIMAIPDYSAGTDTKVTWMAYRDDEYTDAIAENGITVAFVRIDGTDKANALADVFVAGSASMRPQQGGGAASVAWAKDDLFVDYAEDGWNKGDVGGKRLELLVDTRFDLLERFWAFMNDKGPNGDATYTYNDIVDLHLFDSFGLLQASPLLAASYEDDTFFGSNGFDNDGPVGHPALCIQYGALEANVGTIDAANPQYIWSDPIYAFYPCKPGDKFVIDLWIKGGSTNPTIDNGTLTYTSFLGGYFLGPNRSLQGSASLQEVRFSQSDPFQFDNTQWKLYRAEVTCPDNDPANDRFYCWFAPAWRFALISEGSIKLAGARVWKVRDPKSDAANIPDYSFVDNVESEEANNFGARTIFPAQIPVRCTALSIHPFGEKWTPGGGLADLDDINPHVFMSQSPNELFLLLASASTNPSFQNVARKFTIGTEFSLSGSPGSGGNPIFDLSVELLGSGIHSLLSIPNGSVEVGSSQNNGIDEVRLQDSVVLRLEPDNVKNAFDDPRLLLSTWSAGADPYPSDPLFVVREFGGIEANLDNSESGACLQVSSQAYPAYIRIRKRDATINVDEVLGGVIWTGDDPDNNPSSTSDFAKGKGYEVARFIAYCGESGGFGSSSKGTGIYFDLAPIGGGSPVIAPVGHSNEALSRALSYYVYGSSYFGGVHGVFLDLLFDDSGYSDTDAWQVKGEIKVDAIERSGGTRFTRGKLEFSRGQNQGVSGNDYDSVFVVYVNDGANNLKGRFAIDQDGFFWLGRGSDVRGLATADQPGGDNTQVAVGGESTCGRLSGVGAWGKTSDAVCLIVDTSGYILYTDTPQLFDWSATNVASWNGSDALGLIGRLGSDDTLRHVDIDDLHLLFAQTNAIPQDLTTTDDDVLVWNSTNGLQRSNHYPRKTTIVTSSSYTLSAAPAQFVYIDAFTTGATITLPNLTDVPDGAIIEIASDELDTGQSIIVQHNGTDVIRGFGAVGNAATSNAGDDYVSLSLRAVKGAGIANGWNIVGSNGTWTVA